MKTILVDGSYQISINPVCPLVGSLVSYKSL